MKNDVQLRSFITFILLAGVPKNRSVALQAFIQPGHAATPSLDPDSASQAGE